MTFLLRRSYAFFSKPKKTMSDAFKQFLQHDAGSSVRRQPHQKDRKYINVEISQQFKKQEQARKQLRLQHLKARKRLLQQKLTTQSRLLTNQETKELNALNEEMTSLQSLLQAQEKQLSLLDQKLEETQADLILIEGYRKLSILNKIEYLKHMNYHPTGLVLHPDVMTMIENVHYLVNNNLPVNKFKLFQIMPELFETEIKELDKSIQRLIQQKKLDPKSDPSSRIRFFDRHHSRYQDHQQDIVDIQEEREDIFLNMQQEIIKKINTHSPYIKLVETGQTPFRNITHLIAVMISDELNLKFTPEEEALKQTILQCVELKDKFDIYSNEVDEKVIKMRYKYIQPPVWVKNHPVLLQRYEKIMINYTNPKQFIATLPDDPVKDDGRAYLQQKLTNLVIEKYHPKIQQLWNSGRRDQLIASKKQLEIQFYQDSTKLLQEYQQMLAENKEKQQFLKIPKKPREIAEEKHTSISLDELTKTIALNNSNSSKYNLAFFTQHLGLESQEETRKLFNSFSYLRVELQQEKQLQNLKFAIIKFKG